MTPERLAEIKKIRNCVPFIDNGAGVPETQAAIDDLLADNAALREELSLWKEINRDELAETFRLMEALGVVEEVESGTSCMDAMLGKIAALREAVRVLAKSITDVRGTADWPELTHSMRQGLGCGLEDRDIYDRYQAAEYGYEDALDRCSEFIKNATADVDANQLAAAAVREAKEQA